MSNLAQSSTMSLDPMADLTREQAQVFRAVLAACDHADIGGDRQLYPPSCKPTAANNGQRRPTVRPAPAPRTRPLSRSSASRSCSRFSDARGWRQSVSRGPASTLSLGVCSPRASCAFSAASSSPIQRSLRTRFTSSFFDLASAEDSRHCCVRDVNFNSHSPFPLYLATLFGDVSIQEQRQPPRGTVPPPFLFGPLMRKRAPVFSAFFLGGVRENHCGHSAASRICSVAAL
jgi:hypothetical protein